MCGVARMTYNAALAVLFTMLIAVSLGAQSTSTLLEGTVRDPSGKPIPGAVLTAVNEDSEWQFEVVSDAAGRYVFLALPAGTYTVSAKMDGFKQIVRRHIPLLLHGALRTFFVLEPGDSSSIEEQTASGDVLRLNDAQLSGFISAQNLKDLPMPERDPLSLVVYQPGVQILGGNEGYSNVNGTRQGMNEVSMDGVSVTEQVNPRLGISMLATNADAVDVARLITLQGKAEYGRSAGAQIIMASPSGGRLWSGNIFDYFRNEWLDANDFFNNSANIGRPRFKRNIFGASISGPVWKDDTFLFVNFTGQRTKQEVVRNRLVLTPEAKTGLFQWYIPGTAEEEENVQSYDIVANDPRGLGIDPAIAALLARLPDPNNTNIGDGLNNGGFQFNNPVYSNGEQITARVDHTLNDYHRIFVRFSWQRNEAIDYQNNTDARYPRELEGTSHRRYWGLVFGSDWSLNPLTMNQLRAGYARPKTELKRPARSTEAMLLANSWTDPLDPSFPRSYGSPVSEITDNISQFKGRHIIKYGLTYRRTLQESIDRSGIYQNVTFGRNFGNAPSLTIGPASKSLISSEDRQIFENLYNDLLGRMESTTQTFNSDLASYFPSGTGRERNYSFHELAAFIQDDWRIRPNLILNLGLRYQFSSVPKERNGLQGVLDRASEVSKTANISDFTIISGNNWYNSNLASFAPRAGFAWDLFGRGKAVLRGGYGIYYDRLIGALTDFVDQNTAGFSQQVFGFPNSEGTDNRLSDGIPPSSQPVLPIAKPPVSRSSSVAIFDQNLRIPYVQQINATLEMRMFNSIIEASYVSTRGRRLFQQLNWNQTKTEEGFLQSFRELQAYRNTGTPVPSSNTLIKMFGSPLAAIEAIGGFNLDTGQVGIAADIVDRVHYDKYAPAGISDFYLRNYPQFASFMVGTNESESWYDSLQLGIRKNGDFFQARAYYTWSKSLDTISIDGVGFTSPTDSFNPRLDKAPSDFNRRHVLNLASHYALPIGRDRYYDSESRIANAIFANWNLSAMWIWTSGARFSVISDRQTRYAGVTSLADFSGSRNTGNVSRTREGVRWFSPDDTALFSTPATGEPGTSGRNSFIGPKYFNLDVSLFKNFYLGDRSHIQFRFEVYNLLNNVNFSLPETNISEDTFGWISSTQGSPRAIQLALRFEF